MMKDTVASLKAVPPEPKPERKPPHNIELEQAVLGAILVNNRSFERVQETLEATHFFDPLHGLIFETIAEIITANKPATPFSMLHLFENHEMIRPGVSVPQYLGTLAARATTIINIAHYAEQIIELGKRRELIIIGEDIFNTAFDASHASKHAQSIVEDAETSLFKVAEGAGAQEGAVPFKELMLRAANFANLSYQSKGRNGNIPSRFLDLDRKLGGLRKGNLIIIAGRPSMGKTAFATNIAYNVAHQGFEDIEGNQLSGPVGFFSLEMDKEELARRMLASVSGISDHIVQRGTADEKQINKVIAAAKEIEDTPLHIDGRGGIQLAQLVSRARRMKRRFGIQLLVIDYLQLLSSKASGRPENRVQEITEITIGLKALAKELEIPVIALSQLSRAVELREDKKPQLSDLRESGSIEQDADVVIFMYREEYYLSRTEPEHGTADHKEWQEKLNKCTNKAEAIIGKNRHGPIGTVELHFDGNLTLFSNLTTDERSANRLAGVE